MLLAAVQSMAQDAVRHEHKFRTLSPPGGFYYDGVKDIVHDGDGFVWVLLENDLLRFDGYEYKRYYSHFRGEGNASRLQFNDIAADSRGRLHVSSAQGLFIYNRPADSFDKLLNLSSKTFFDTKDNAWVCLNDCIGILRGVDSLDVKLSINEVYSAESCADGSFLVASFSGSILRYDYSTDTFTPFHTFPANHYILKIQRTGDRLWVLLRNQGIVVFDIPSQRIETTYDFPLKYENMNILLRDLLVDKHGHVWIATQQGIWFFNPHTLERRMYRHSETDIFSLTHNSVWKVTDDPEGNIWIGTFSGGLCMVDPDEEKSFTTYVPRRSGLNHNAVSAFAEDDRALWVGTEGGGVNRLDKATGEFSYLDTGSGSSLPGNHIKSLVCDNGNRLWIATYLGGLIRYDIDSGRLRHFNRNGPGNERLLSNNLREIVPENDSGLWIAYQLSGHVVSFLPTDSGPVEHHYFDTQGEQWYIWDMCRSRDWLWIVTPQKLYRMDVQDRSVVDVSSDKIPFLNAQSLCADNDGNVWVGTISGTILRYDIGTEEFSTVTGLADYNASTVYNLCFDGEGSLWMGTDNGLFRYVPRTGKFSRFDESDGAQGSMYNPLASMHTVSGKLLFGGTNGFSIVDPLAVMSSAHVPKAMLSEFIIDNSISSPRLGKDMSDTYYGCEIVVSHKETSFGFIFASDNFAAPAKSHFRYRLHGYDPVPVTVDGDSRSVIYSNVRAGTYRFDVAASADGETWGEPVTVRIVRRPAPWNSRVAWMLYFVVVLTVVGTIIYYRLEKRRLAMQIYLDGLDKEKKEEIHQSQMRFFTNISHDFRTPLSLIQGTVDNLHKEGIGDYYYKILNSNSQRLLSLVNELMDFRTVENGKMRLQVQPSEINRIVEDIAADFSDMAREKNIDFRVECDRALSSLVYVDRAVVEKIVMNLLNNAFKYTPQGGTITISTFSPESGFGSAYSKSHRISTDGKASRHFIVAVSDTGVGVSGESISKVFERFFKVNTANADSHLGTGIGLALVKSLVLLHRGAITIFSERNRGTDMVVELPFDWSVYGPDEFRRESVEGDQSRFISAEPDGKIDMAGSAAESMLMRSRKRVLLVEDNGDLRTLITNFLSSEYEIVQAADGLIASEWLSSGEADLIVCDIMMPHKDGVTLCREVKENVATSHIPFVMLTAKTDMASKLEGAGSGADLYFEKPVDLNLLALSIGNIFSRQSAMREYYSKNYFVEDSELAQNEHDNTFLKKFVDIIDCNLAEPVMDVYLIASELSMSRSKLYSKLKALTGKSIVEFILDYRMRKAARLIIEDDMSLQQVMESVGIRSQSYFTSVFKKEFGQTPLAFAKSHSKRLSPNIEQKEQKSGQ